MMGFVVVIIVTRHWRRLQVHALSQDLADSSVINVGADFGKVGQFQSQINVSSSAATQMESFDVI
jgi:hypothetical protein